MPARYAKFAPWMAATASFFTFGCNTNNEGIKDVGSARHHAGNESAEMAESNTREYSFEMVGFACRDPENPISSKQAAIIETLCSALIEARRCRGESTSNFTVRIGDRLTITHKGTTENHDLHLVLKDQGKRIRFDVCNGVLRSRIQDFETLQRLFDVTNGEFALLSLESSDEMDGFNARVGCYLPNNPGLFLASDLDANGDTIDP